MRSHVAIIDGHRLDVSLDESRAIIEGQSIAYSHQWLDRENLMLICNGKSYDLQIENVENGLRISYRGRWYDVELADARSESGQRDPARTNSGRQVVKSPMPGMVLRVLVEVGQAVSRGDRLIVLEAMKMENDVKAPRAGQITSVGVASGQKIETGRELVVIE